MANGKIVYPSGDPAPTTYTFVQNFDYGDELGYLETHEHNRTLDGTLQSYLGALKKSYLLKFSMAPLAQFEQFSDLYAAGYAVDLYLNGVNLDAAVKLMRPPRRTTEPAWRNGEYTCTFEVEMEEV